MISSRPTGQGQSPAVWDFRLLGVQGFRVLGCQGFLDFRVLGFQGLRVMPIAAHWLGSISCRVGRVSRCILSHLVFSGSGLQVVGGFRVLGFRVLGFQGFRVLGFQGFRVLGSSPYTRCISITARTKDQMVKDPRQRSEVQETPERCRSAPVRCPGFRSDW